MKLPKQHFFIYLLVNKINGMIYVGETCQEKVEDRMGKDGSAYSNSPRIYEALQTFGCENFFYHTLDHAYGESECARLEQHYMDEFDAKNPEVGYNIKNASSNGKHHESTKEQISATLKAQFAAMTPEQQKAKIDQVRNWWKGKKRGPRTSEQKEAQSKMMEERHKTQGHPMKGKHHTEESRAKISAANKGKKQSPEFVAKLKAREELKRDHQKEAGIIADYQAGMKIKDIKKKHKHGHPDRVLKRHGIPLIRKRRSQDE